MAQNGLPSWTCIVCEKHFTVKDGFLCVDGTNNHVVADKLYLLADAPSDPGHSPKGSFIDDRREGRTRICNIPPDKTVLRNGEAAMVPGGYVEFIRGRFSTTNPEIQYYLDKKGGFCTEEQWQANWLNDAQKIEQEKILLARERSRLENERNELLTMTKQKTVGARA